jgi:type II secretory pathway component PulK
VLWVLAGIATLAAALLTAANESVATSRNRLNLTAASWLAEECIERGRAAIAHALTERARELALAGRSPWRRLDREVRDSPYLSDQTCSTTLWPAGITLNANAVSEDELRHVFAAIGIAAATIDSLTAALMDWRDADNETREAGAESDWYLSRHMLPPRNGAMEVRGEVRLIRGFAEYGLDSLLGTESERIALEYAPVAVLQALPGIDGEVASHIAWLRSDGREIRELAAVTEGLSADAAALFTGAFRDLVTRVTLDPDAWVLSGRAAVGTPPVEAHVQLRLERSGTRAAVMRRVTNP